ncbi:hypothetical protein BSKO_06136 [Bryopsis sp. KO-2023]|nr:hypothetical protein BSKO_06136 [Bryopsis sp. KO-2023]
MQRVFHQPNSEEQQKIGPKTVITKSNRALGREPPWKKPKQSRVGAVSIGALAMDFATAPKGPAVERPGALAGWYRKAAIPTESSFFEKSEPSSAPGNQRSAKLSEQTGGIRGNAEQMWMSLSKMMILPPETPVYSAHEYTQSNAKFALTVDPQNPKLIARKKQVDDMRAKKLQGQWKLEGLIGFSLNRLDIT